MVFENEYGRIELSIDVVKALVYKAMISTFGLVDVSVQNLIIKFFGKEEEKGIKVMERDGRITIDLFVIFEYGVVIPRVARNLQENVYHELSRMIGSPPESVNVHILGLNLE